MGFRTIDQCRCCGGSNLHKFIDLGKQPLANSYHNDDELPEYPLAVNVCKNCWHTQLTVVVDPDEMFKNYVYVSGTTQTLRDYFEWFANSVVMQCRKSNGTVLDIACNDGSQLDAFQKQGWKTIGVDPATNLVPIARAKGHEVIEAYWSEEVAQTFENPVDVIIAQNVFAHTHDILGFLLACKTIMHEETKLYIQTSQANMYKNGEFDTIYHEHLSFFNSFSMQTICQRAGLFLTGVEKSSIHGTSFIFRIQKKISFHQETDLIEQIQEENHGGLYYLDTYTQFGQRAQATLAKLRHAVSMGRSADYTVVGYGAAAKGMTVLNAGRIYLDYIIDDNPLKQGLLTPGSNIPIVSAHRLAKTTGPILFVPLAWNFYDEIVSRIKSIRNDPRDRFVRYFPKFETT
jgi:2-polyprenyl-3-methyl-5-hydroxy-6-metoxy-1,4-benzoquinol methylase